MFLHMDLDCFFVSCERTRDSSLIGKPVAVGGRGDPKIFSPKSTHAKKLYTENRGHFVPLVFQDAKETQNDNFQNYFMDADGRVRGIVVAASYEARKHGIFTGTTINEALKLCPHITIRPPDHLLYHELSHHLHDFLALKIPVMEQYSVDEFFGDISGWVKPEDVYLFAKSLKQEIWDQFQLPISIGIAPAKWIAKLATNFAKPNGVHYVPQNEIPAFIEKIPVNKFPGIGRAFSKKLQSYKIDTLGEAARANKLFESWGWQGIQLYRRITGTDNEPIQSHSERKSIGISRTFDPLLERNELHRRIIILSRHLAHTIARLGLNPCTFHFGIKYEYGAKAYHAISENRLFNEAHFRNLALQTFKQMDRYSHTSVIRLSMSGGNFLSQHPKTLSLLEYQEDLKMNRLLENTTALRNKFGIDIIRSGEELVIDNIQRRIMQ